MNFDLQTVMQKVQEMQAKMESLQKELADKQITTEVGGGMVSVTVNGNQEIVKISIEKDVVNPDEVEMLEDLVVAGVNKALAEAKKMAKDEMGKATGGMLPDIPGLNLGL